jgi:uncharacterized repeat protein (TIGR01451 family)
VVLPIVVATDPSIASGTSLQFDGVATSSAADKDLTNNIDNADTSILSEADLRVLKSSDPNPVVAGEGITYTIVVDNFGPSVAKDVQLMDALPGQVTLSTVATTQGVCLNTLCFLGDMAPGGAVTITIRAQVKPDVADGTVIINAASASSPTSDPGVYQNFDTAASVVSARASLRIDKRDMNDPIAPEESLVYFIEVSNDGPGDALNVVVTDTLPAHLTYESSTDSCTETTPGILSCQLGAVAANSSVNFLVTTRVANNVITGTLLSNHVEVSSSTPLTNSVLTDTEETRVIQRFGAPSDLAIAKTAFPDPVTAGEVVTYTLVITNNGTGAAVDVEVVDALPEGLTLISATPSQGLCTQPDSVTCLLGSMPFNGVPSTATIEIVARVNADVADGTTLVNTAFVQSGQPDPTPDNNTAQAAVDVTTLADLAVSKSAPATVVAGNILTYTIDIINLGPSDAAGVQFTDTLPADVQFLSGQGCSASGQQVLCTVGDLAAGATTSALLAVRVPATATGNLHNQVVVGSLTPDPDPANNSASAETQVRGLADIRITKEASRDVTTAGGLITYTLKVVNAGPSLAQSVTVTDPLPAFAIV